MFDKQSIISKLNLEPHPEGGFFRRTFTTGHGESGHRLLSSCIYFLIEHGNPSSLHKVDVDEYWLYHGGTSDVVLKGFSTNEATSAFTTQLGNDCGQWHYLIPKHTWFGAKAVSTSPDAFALVSCICTPAFEFSGFSLGSRNQLLATYPNHRLVIDEMCAVIFQQPAKEPD